MNDMKKLKYDLALCCASVMVQQDMASSELPQGIFDVRNKMISYAADFAEILSDGTMSEDSLVCLLQLLR